MRCDESASVCVCVCMCTTTCLCEMSTWYVFLFFFGSSVRSFVRLWPTKRLKHWIIIIKLSTTMDNNNCVDRSVLRITSSFPIMFLHRNSVVTCSLYVYICCSVYTALYCVKRTECGDGVWFGCFFSVVNWFSFCVIVFLVFRFTHSNWGQFCVWCFESMYSIKRPKSRRWSLHSLMKMVRHRSRKHTLGCWIEYTLRPYRPMEMTGTRHRSLRLVFRIIANAFQFFACRRFVSFHVLFSHSLNFMVEWNLAEQAHVSIWNNNKIGNRNFR